MSQHQSVNTANTASSTYSYGLSKPSRTRFLSMFAVVAASVLGALPTQSWAQTAVVSADFGSRIFSQHSIPANMLGVGLGGGLHGDTLPLLTQAGLTYTRFHAVMQDTYATATPNWTELDSELSPVGAAGLHVILEMDFTPASLQPANNPCPTGSDAYHASPTNLATLAAMATAYVRHIDQAFPGVVVDYEVWNEPDGGGLCTANNTDAEKLSEYLQIYAAVAPAIHNAAAQDGVVVRTGGPALGAPLSNATEWLGALLNNTATAPFVDFVSFHYYVSGSKDVAKGLTWDGTNGTPSLLAMTQSTGSAGFANVYKRVSALVSSGLQPNAGATPIYLDEYNSDWAFVNDCCRNDPTYSPVWNAMVYVDLLNSVYSGAAQVPSKILYYAVSNHPFCIAGVWDANMDCQYPSSGLPTPYPQYYAMQLFASRSYLDLQDGGNMALWNTSSDSSLLTTAFWTAAGDTIVMVNPTGTDYSGVSVLANHTNIPGAHGVVDVVNSSNNGINTRSIFVAHTAIGYATAVDVPAHSVVAVTIAQ